MNLYGGSEAVVHDTTKGEVLSLTAPSNLQQCSGEDAKEEGEEVEHGPVVHLQTGR